LNISYNHRERTKTMPTTNTIDMRTLNCPYGCDNELVMMYTDWGTEVWGDEGCWTVCPSDIDGDDECEDSFGVIFKNADQVCDIANDRVSEYKKALGVAYAKRSNLNARIEAQEKDLAKAIRLSERISKQHG